MITKEQVQTLVRLLNVKLVKRADLTALDYGGYIEMIEQLAFFIFSKPPHDYSYLSPKDQLMKMIQYFEKATRSRG